MKISRILHAGYLFEDAETIIAFDPIFENPFSGNCHAFPSVRFDLNQIRSQKFSAVFISHFHDDHCSFESLDLVDRQTPIYIYCQHEELFVLVRELGFKNINSLTLDQSVTIGTLEVTPRKAFDSEVDSIFQIKCGDLNVLNVVDSVMDPDTLNILKTYSPWDLILWPFQMMRETAVLTPSRATDQQIEFPEDWFDDLRALQPRYLVPSSCQFVQEPWSWYNHALFPISYQRFEREMSAALPFVEVVRMNPGTSLVLDKSSFKATAPLSWVVASGPQDVDYVFQPELKVPPTSEIATKFAALSTEETSLVFEYCRTEMLQRFNKLDSTPYFASPKNWRLSIFDHAGRETRLHYRVHQNSAESISETDDISWVTEVAISKLYAAIEQGEALTSMYMRINDCVLTPEVEAELTEMDVLEDPMIRTLFNGRFGAYQQQQLRRLKARASEPQI